MCLPTIIELYKIIKLLKEMFIFEKTAFEK